tara:strand:+ start:6144 stop:6965 length:822 start_codon:yes stop_codon:yes gene_type:complete
MIMNTTLPTIVIRGAGDLATGVALRLYRAGLRNIVMLETLAPLAVRRTVAFSECIKHDTMTVEGVTAVCIDSANDTANAWAAGDIPVLVDPEATTLPDLQPEIVVDAIIAKRNLGTDMSMAPLVIGLGPGFVAGKDVHVVIETMRGHHLGRVITDGPAKPNTGIPGTIAGYSIERVCWAETSGIFTTAFNIGDTIGKGEELGRVDNTPVLAKVDGVIRGLLRNGTPVKNHTKLGDVDPRGTGSYCNLASDKAMAIGGGVLEAICNHIFMKRLL